MCEFMNRMQKIMLYRIFLSVVLFIIVVILPISGWLRFFAFLIPYLVVGWDVIYKTVKHACKLDIFDENSLMFIATIGAFALNECAEAVMVVLLYQIGELFQDCASDFSRKSISSLMDIRPDYANLKLENGATRKVLPNEVGIGDIIVVKPGEKVPLDGVVKKGFSSVDTSSMTGESAPRVLEPGDEIVSGCVNMTGVLEVRVQKTFGESTVVKVLDLIENSKNKKAKSENFIKKFAKIYTPCVVIAAFLLAVFPAIFFGQDFEIWLERALIFLVISCPCALVISIPMSLFGGIGGASRAGILVKGGNYLETLARVKTVIFDKTGTLTSGKFSVIDVSSNVMSGPELIEIAALAESHIHHPIANSIKSEYAKPIDESRVKDVRQISGLGVKATVDGNRVCVGNSKFMRDMGVEFDLVDSVGTVVYLTLNGKYIGNIVISDKIKEGARSTVCKLKSWGVDRVVMLTGDRKIIGENVAKQLDIDGCYCELLPNEKVEKLEQFLKNRRLGQSVIFVGDGVNDAPVLSLADVGVAMGAIGSDAAMEAADIVLMDDDIKKIPLAIKISKKTMNIVKQNIIFSLGVKFVILALGSLGITNMWLAIFADVGVSMIAILNALRSLKVKSK